MYTKYYMIAFIIVIIYYNTSHLPSAFRKYAVISFKHIFE